MTAPASPRQVLLDLADRCEKERPSRELDAALAKSAGVDSRSRRTSRGVNKGREWRVDSHGGVETWERRPPAYTSSLDAAVTLLAEGCEWELTNLYDIAVASVGLNRANGNWQSGAHKGGHLALALCAASLRARAEAL